MALYVIGIGGTGSKCIEAIIHASASGLFPKEQTIKILFVDADETNGILERSRKSLEYYEKCYKALNHQNGSREDFNLLNTRIESYDLWSPFSDRIGSDKNLASFFQYNNIRGNNQGLGNLFDVLYTKDEREADLDVGFRGRPSIGSAVMSQLILDDLKNSQHGSWNQLVADIRNDNDRKILLCGSIFGGTGASGLPTVSRLIDQELKEIRSQVKISGLFLLPYFSFKNPEALNDKDKVFARTENFLLNTDAALRYYTSQSKQFDRVYLLGNQNYSQYETSIGKSTQRNESHFIELYAALAVRDFLLNPPSNDSTKVDKQVEVKTIGRSDKNRISWKDIPEETEIRKNFQHTINFAYIWLNDIVPEFNKALSDPGELKKLIKTSPWIEKFFSVSEKKFSIPIFSGKELPKFNQEQEPIKNISEWCEDYFNWIINIHEKSGDKVELIDHQYLKNPKLDDDEWYDTVRQLKNKLNEYRNNSPSFNSGTYGLAEAIFKLGVKYLLPKIILGI